MDEEKSKKPIRLVLRGTNDGNAYCGRKIS